MKHGPNTSGVSEPLSVHKAQDFLRVLIREGAQGKVTLVDNDSDPSAIVKATSPLSSSGSPKETVNNVLKTAFPSHLTLLHQMK